jgi:uncharacterized protein (DUF952 family)
MKIYKILTPDQWDVFQRDSRFDGAPIDVSDGYIHFSTAQQTKETVAKHFADHQEIVLLEIDTESLDDRLKWEPSRGGALFPHLYASLQIDSVDQSWTLQRELNGDFLYPDPLN